MASFRTHLVIGSIASISLAAATYSLNIADIQDLLVLSLVGVFASLLPDIDSDHSRATSIIFNIFGISAACLIFFWFYNILPKELLIIETLAAYVLVRFPVKYLFMKFSIHRGIFHSVLAAVLFALSAVSLCNSVFGCEPRTSWLAGVFVLAGYIVHLSLDEIYSVDFSNQRIKRSFGTALKLFCFKRIHNSIFATILAVLAYTTTPHFDLLDAIAHQPALTDTNELVN